jgi:hypothetical protein
MASRSGLPDVLVSSIAQTILLSSELFRTIPREVHLVRNRRTLCPSERYFGLLQLFKLDDCRGVS